MLKLEDFRIVDKYRIDIPDLYAYTSEIGPLDLDIYKTEGVGLYYGVCDNLELCTKSFSDIEDCLIELDFLLKGFLQEALKVLNEAH